MSWAFMKMMREYPEPVIHPDLAAHAITAFSEIFPDSATFGMSYLDLSTPFMRGYRWLIFLFVNADLSIHHRSVASLI